MLVEEWRDVKGFEGYYKVSSLGDFYSVRRNKMLRQFITNAGYYKCCLSVKGKKTDVYAHREVAKAFVEGYEEGKEVNHKDGIKTNNIYTNLEWVTDSENKIHAFKNGLMSNKHLMKPVEQLDYADEVIATYDSLESACKINGISESHLSEVCNGKRKRTGGYKWRFKNVKY